MTPVRAIGVAILATLILGCESATQDDNGTPRPAADPVVVYAAYTDKTYLPALFSAYTQETGVTVIVRNGKPSKIVDDVIANRISPPADVLWATSVTGAWRAAEEGELRPLRLPGMADNVMPVLRDTDNYWTAVSYHKAAIIYNPKLIEPPEQFSFADLATPDFANLLCLSSSANNINQAVIATLIDTSQVRDAEIVVRGWMSNLAMPVFAGEGDLIAAIQSGECGVGIATGTVAIRAAADDSDVAIFVPRTTAADAEAVGVTRHGQNPDGGTALVEWLLSADVQSRHARSRQVLPANWTVQPPEELRELETATTGETGVIIVAVDRHDAQLLAERARYR